MMTHALCFVFWCQLLWHPPGVQFSEKMLHDNFAQQNLWEMIAELRNCEETILHAFPHKLHKVVRKDRLPPTAHVTNRKIPVSNNSQRFHKQPVKFSAPYYKIVPEKSALHKHYLTGLSGAPEM